jgi:opacity protein-like surface antigen
MRSSCSIGTSFLLFVLLAVPAGAQDGGARVSGNFGATFGEDETNIATGGSVGYRFTPHLGFDFEVLVLPDLELGDSTGFGRILDPRRLDALLPPSVELERSSRAVAFLANYVAEFPIPAGWLIPYIEGGGGVANISRTFVITPSLASRSRSRPEDILTDRRFLQEFDPLEIRRSETNLALTVGGGVDFQVWGGLAVGANLRYLRLFGNPDLDLTRIGGRVTYRF